MAARAVFDKKFGTGSSQKFLDRLDQLRQKSDEARKAVETTTSN
jgi:hypothetical protein